MRLERYDTIGTPGYLIFHDSQPARGRGRHHLPLDRLVGFGCWIPFEWSWSVSKRGRCATNLVQGHLFYQDGFHRHNISLSFFVLTAVSLRVDCWTPCFGGLCIPLNYIWLILIDNAWGVPEWWKYNHINLWKSGSRNNALTRRRISVTTSNMVRFQCI